MEDAVDSGLARTLTAFASGRYQLVRALGAGGQKVVFLVRDVVLERECALALLSPDAQAAGGFDALLEEARAVARLGSHPHIAAVFDVGTHEGGLFVVSEFAAGGDVRAALREAGGTFPAPRALDLGRQILRALAFVHAHGIVHRDVKPENVWLGADGTAKLGDFGIALRNDGARPAGSSGSPPVAGTPLYMAPEQILGRPLDGRCDLYALGCVLYELVSGAPPFVGDVPRVIAAHVREPPPALEAWGADVAALSQFVAALLAKDPDQRPATATDALRLLDDLQANPASANTAQGVTAPASAPASDWIGAYDAAMARGDPGGAVKALRARIDEAADPEARMMLARVLHVSLDLEGTRRELELALDAFTQQNLPRRAALAAARIGVHYAGAVGDKVAARAWTARAFRMVNALGPCVERGWVALADVACAIEDPGELRERADVALDMARRFGDGDLEAKALADSGAALAELGPAPEGMARLDEALALATSGGVRDKITVAQICCAFFSACAVTGDLARCESWGRILRERNMIGARGSPVLTSHCDTAYGGLLCELGRFGEAESVLESAAQVARSVYLAGQLRARAAFADLRIQQGRLEEAQHLLEGQDDHLEAVIPSARLHLAKGDLGLAAATARRGLRLLGGDRTRAVVLLCVLIDAELRRGNVAAACAAREVLDGRVAGTPSPALAAQAATARARVLEAKGERDAAVHELEAALAGCSKADLPLARARLHVELARLHAHGDADAARLEAQAASAICARTGVTLSQPDTSVLRDLGVGDAAPRAP